jgi:hypothetical protein
MDGTTGVSSSTASSILSGGASDIAVAVLNSNQHLVESEVKTLFGSLGLGTAISALA